MLSSRPAEVPYFAAKTPGRTLKNNRSENAMTTVKRVGGSGINPKTPFQPQGLFKDKLQLTSKPLGDKTPMPNRIALLLQTPLNGGQKGNQKGPSKLQHTLEMEKEGTTPESLMRPSSMRRQSKVPQSARKSLVENPSFRTPDNQGRHWEVSDGEENTNLAEGTVSDSEQQSQEAEDDDELEFAFPNNLDLPYQPLIDYELPDFKILGQNLRSLAFSIPSYHQDELPPQPEPTIEVMPETPWNELLPRDELEDIDDPFYQARKEAHSQPKSKVTPSTKPTTTSSSTKTFLTRKLPTSQPSGPISSRSATKPTNPTQNRPAIRPQSRPTTSASLYPHSVSNASSTAKNNPNATTGVKQRTLLSNPGPTRPSIRPQTVLGVRTAAASTSLRSGTSSTSSKSTLKSRGNARTDSKGKEAILVEQDFLGGDFLFDI